MDFVPTLVPVIILYLNNLIKNKKHNHFVVNGLKKNILRS